MSSPALLGSNVGHPRFGSGPDSVQGPITDFFPSPVKPFSRNKCCGPVLILGGHVALGSTIPLVCFLLTPAPRVFASGARWFVERVRHPCR